ncbi:DUF7010 family protein [Sphingobium ummariense]|uniref:Uncharacterized protein n=1 Tax=Sphingobium ummariense RL-3 TaxID=1346791 RepID=T0K415_9SPHN|nr:hypothetical protein [Sphingobium ummariense]EQB31249.1 hypothetical protein M529_16040 [Sphingobium ummariense RL-3]
MTFDEMRVDFIVRRRGSLALPITGLIVYSTAALLSLAIAAPFHNLVLALCFWAIMPLGLLVGRLRGEDMSTPPENPLLRLSAMARIMALATWAIHIPIWIHAPALFPLSVGIGFALHWVVFSWTIGHPLGLVHLAMRIVFVLTAWHLFPGNRMGAVSIGIALAYGISLFQLRRVDWQARLGLKVDPLRP